MGDPRRESLPSKSPELGILLQAAQEDSALREFFQQVVRMKERERNAFLARKLSEADRRETPEAFRRALASLRDPAILDRLLKLL